jgi:hypothetical protein
MEARLVVQGRYSSSVVQLLISRILPLARGAAATAAPAGSVNPITSVLLMDMHLMSIVFLR